MDHCQSDLDRGKLDIHSTHHKQDWHMGQPLWFFKGMLFKHYITNIQPNIAASASMEVALLTAHIFTIIKTWSAPSVRGWSSWAADTPSYK